MLLDLKYAIHSLARSHGFALAVIVTLGLGIGANTAIFSAVRGVLLRPLPHRDGDRLVFLRQSAELKGSDNIGFSVPEPQAEFRTADPGGYFKASGMKIVAGRDFDLTDNAKSARVAIVNQTLAKLLYPGLDPIGRRLTWTGDVLKFIGLEETWLTVVGVVADTKDGGLDKHPARAVVRSVDPSQPVEKLMALVAIRDESVGPRRINAMLIGSFSLLALVIAAIGIVAVLAFSVSARTNEIGIRMSLGADSGMVQRMVLGEGGVLLGAGLVLGVVGAVFTTRLIQGLLFGVTPNDPATIMSVAAVMTAIGVGACWLPARRASKIDPAMAMRGK